MVKKVDLSLVCGKISAGYSVASIADTLGVSRNTIHKKLSDAGISTQRLKFNHDFFEIIHDEATAYWFGFIMADGCVSLSQSPKVQIRLHEKDIEHLRAWHKALNSCLSVGSSNGIAYSTHYSRKMCDDLIKHGCVPRKSWALDYPYHIDTALRNHFVRGYFDGDGCVYHNNDTNNWQLSFVGTERMILGIQHDLGTSVKLQHPSNAFKIDIHGNQQVARCMQYMYTNATIWLSRKKEKYFGPL